MNISVKYSLPFVFFCSREEEKKSIKTEIKFGVNNCGFGLLAPIAQPGGIELKDL